MTMELYSNVNILVKKKPEKKVIRSQGGFEPLGRYFSKKKTEKKVIRSQGGFEPLGR